MRKKKIAYKRPSWDKYFLEVAHLVAKRSTCLRRSVGAVIVKNKRILATGYNGAPAGLKHCIDIGCLREKLKIPSGERHELCLPPEEKIFTDKGYIPIVEVKLGQRVLTHKGVYRKVTRLFKREYKGKLYYVEPWHRLPVALSPEHPILAAKTQKCQFDTRTLCKETCKSVNNVYCNKPYLNYELQWIPACKLNEKDMLPLLFEDRDFSIDEIDLSFLTNVPSEYYRALEERCKGESYLKIKDELNVRPSTAYNWVRGGVPRDCIAICNGNLKHGSSLSKSIPSKIKLTPGLFKLIGFYLAEGCSSSNQVSFSFHRKEKEFIREVKNNMKEIFGLDCYEDERGNSHKLVYSSIILAKAFKILFGADAYTKRLPFFLTRISPENQQHILTAYFQGDGYKIDQNTTSITTASETLALQVVQILLRMRRTPLIDKGRNVYRVVWKNKLKLPYSYLKDNIFFSPVRKIWSKEYSGYVYNLEVEGDNSYITKSFIVHNCRALHAEQNAFIQAALYGISVENSILYATNQPCVICAKMLINAGIKEIVIDSGYPDKLALNFLKEAKIKVRRIRVEGR
jgi:deoxycytidylate deaminase